MQTIKTEINESEIAIRDISPQMEADGERFLPGLMHGSIELEHFHRYSFAGQLVADKVVLDIASGEGYGSAYLAKFARQVIGVDIAKTAVDHANLKYSNDNLQYLVGACSSIPLEDNAVDVVVSFETIEHHSEHEAMMREIKRVLRPGGMLVISSPDKHEYSDKLSFQNPFHVKELYLEEFQFLLNENFENVRLYGQRAMFASALLSLADSKNIVFQQFGSDTAPNPNLPDPVYWVALASDEELPVTSSGFFEKPLPDLWRDLAAKSNEKIAELLRAVAHPDSNLLKSKLLGSWYLQRNPDVVEAGVDSYKHWLSNGVAEGRLPVSDPVNFVQELVGEREQSLHTVIEEKEREIRQLHQDSAERQRVLEMEIAQIRLKARDEIDGQLRMLAERERAFSEQLVQLQQLARDERAVQMEAAQRQVALLAEQNAQREQSLHTAIEVKERELRQMQQDSAERQRVLEMEIAQTRLKARDEIDGQLRMLAEQERDMYEKLLEAQQKVHSIERQWSEESSIHQQNLLVLRRESEGFQRQLKEQDIAAKQAEYQWKLAFSYVQNELDALKHSISWRITTPLRKIMKWVRIDDTSHSVSALPADTVNLVSHVPDKNSHILTNSSVVSQPYQSEEQIFKCSLESITHMQMNEIKTVDSLLTLHDQAFICAAYQSLLGRNPDPEGMNHYLSCIRKGVNKLEILRQMKDSSEGRSQQKIVIGLDEAVTKEKWKNLPLIGVFFGGGIKESIRRTNSLENQLCVISQQLKSHHDAVKSTLNCIQDVLNESLRQHNNDFHGESTANSQKIDRDYELVVHSGLFDSEYYQSLYQDVTISGIDPLFHYINYGWIEGRNPSIRFDTKFYLEKYSDVKDSGINPLVHYIKFGKSEGRHTSAIGLLTDISFYEKFFGGSKSISKVEVLKPIDIIIPIYNGYEYLEPLFGSVSRNTSLPYRLIVVNDCSPDLRISEFLSLFKSNNPHLNMLLLENEENLGFVKSVNKAVSLIENHFVLLNSDIEVPQFWLERLMSPILMMQNVASTTPFTNSGTICSFPNYLDDNQIFEGLSVEKLDGFFQYVNFDENYLEIPTGVGFCMGVNKDVVDQIGMFDENFGKGYAEENDWCMRAREKGYRNLHVPNLFVYHKHGGSFPSEEKQRLLENNFTLLCQKHPSYESEVHEFVSANQLSGLREFLIMLISSNEFRTNLIFDNELGGGAHHYRTDKVEQLIKSGEAVVLISYDFFKNKEVILNFLFKSYRFSFAVKNIYDLLGFFQLLKIDELVINSFVSFADVEIWLALVRKIKELAKCKLVFLLHDYFAICPSYTLINNKGAYCGVPNNLKDCSTCIQENNNEFKIFQSSSDILEWRAQWEGFLKSCDEIVCFSKASSQILSNAYPMLNTSSIVIRPHDISGRFKKIYRKRKNGHGKRIGILGGINAAKGAGIVRDLVNYVDVNNLNSQIVLFGEINIPIRSESFEMTGRYKSDELEQLILEKKIDVFLIPSIWPETFSYTTDEVMQMGYPLVVFNLGAPAERVKNYPLGKVIEIDELYKTLFDEM